MAAGIEFLKMLILSALVGGLIGTERELKVKPVAGARTFMLIAMFGTISTYIADLGDEPGVILLAFFGIVLIAAIMGAIKNLKMGDFGVTTSSAFLITFLLGVMVGKGFFFESVAGAMLVTAILVSKTYLKTFSENLTRSEIINTLEFGLIAFVIYPILPDEPIDPFGVVNPKTLVFIVIIVASIGFAAFLALRKFGVGKGLPVVGMLGGIVSSEATAVALSHRARERVKLLHPSLVGILFTNSTMLIRNLVIAGVLSIGVMKLMLIPQFVMVAVALIYSYLLKPEEKIEELEIPLRSPFAIKPSIQFAIFFTIVSFIVSFVKDYSVGGVYLAAILGGLVSSAAVTASFASLASIGSLDLSVAASACVLSSIGSTLSKIIVAKISGTPAFAKEVAKVMLIVVVVGIISLNMVGGL